MNLKKYYHHIPAANTYRQDFEQSQSELNLQQQKKSPVYTAMAKGKKVARLMLLLILLLFSISDGYSQKLTQSIRGTVIDQESKTPIIGATILIVGSDPLLGSSSRADGTFEIRDVPVGRHTLKISSIGYEDAIIPELLLGSGKEVVLTIHLQEAYTSLQEITVTAEPEKGQPLNEMATVSARSFTVEETQRYAASLNDPGRMVLSFAGVSSNDDVSNEIVVRGNSPRGVQWRIEGIEVPNPNHFGSEGSTGGGVSMMSANMMDVSDFYTGAFPAEYGNAYSGIFDINLRRGNNQKREYALQVGLLGVDFAAEGPFSANYKGSYLVNYRYSTLSILSELGMDAFGDAIPVFQDLSWKVHLPAGKKGVFNFWGIGGLSNQSVTDEKIEADFRYNMGVSGLSHRILLSDKTYLETILTASRSMNAYEQLEKENIFHYKDDFEKTTYRGSVLVNHKLSGLHTLRAGLIASHERFDLLQGYENADTSLVQVAGNGETELVQGYAQWKSRLSRDLTLNAGLHSMYLRLNGHYTLEPRLGMRWNMSPTQSLNAGFGVHSKMEPLIIYFSRYKEGSLPNKNLDFMNAWHYILGYEWAFRPDWLLKAEAYYQQLSNVPIAAGDIDLPEALVYSSINYRDGQANFPLVNEGKGRNYGIELSLEKFFTHNYYFTLTGSLYESKYTPRDGIERDSRFGGNYNLNLLLGKEFHVGRSANNIIGINLRTLSSGGNRWTPVLLEESRSKGEGVYDWSRPFAEREGMYFRTDIRLSYRRNKPRHASIWSLDIQNVSNHRNVWAKYYDINEKEVKTWYQMGFLPVLNYRLEF